MKRLFGLLNLLLCLELIIGPHWGSITLAADSATSCPNGFNYDSTLNRCLTSAQTANVMNAVSNCAATDVSCYKANAESALSSKEQSGEVSKAAKGTSGFHSVVNAAAVAVPVTVAIASLKDAGSQCASYSYYAMIGGAASLFIGDNLANYQHKKRLASIRKDWDKIIRADAGTETDKDKQKVNATEAQSQAFEMLARSEDSLAKAAGMKSKFYMIATGAFAASAVLAMMETSTSWTQGGAICEPKKSAATNTTQTDVSAATPTEGATTHPVTQGEVNASPIEPSPAAGAAPTDVSAPAPTTNSPVTDGAPKVQYDVANPGTRTIDYADGTRTTLSPNGEYSIKTPNAAGPTQVIKHESGIIETRTPLKSPGGGFLDKKHIKKIKDIYFKNIKSSEDFASFYTLHAHYLKNTSPISSPSLEDYEKYKGHFKGTGVDEIPEVLQLVKDVSLKMMNEMSPFPKAHAQLGNVAGTAAIGGVMHYSKASKWLASQIRTPVNRAIFSGVLGGWTLIMYNHAKSQEKASSNRATALRKMRDDFKDASGALNLCSPSDRMNVSKPECYCYTSDGARNSARTNSQTCQKLWAGKSTKAGDYLTGSSEYSGCIDSSNKADANCSCRKTNRCLKVTPRSITGLNIGSFSMLSSALKPVDQMGNGTFNSGSFNAEAAGANAMRLVAAAKKLENAPQNAAIKKNKDAYAKKLEADLRKAGQGMSPNLGDSGSGMPMNPAQAVAELEKELKKDETPITTANSPTSLGQPAAPTEKLEFGMTQDDLAVQETQIAETMKHDLDYGQNDINQGSKTNIFEVLSNRYQRSGMRRLFDESGKSSADKPAESDITK